MQRPNKQENANWGCLNINKIEINRVPFLKWSEIISNQNSIPSINIAPN